jgi:hypothetical protein
MTPSQETRLTAIEVLLNLKPVKKNKSRDEEIKQLAVAIEKKKMKLDKK